jgi:DNA-binding transcriptional LysR family regulator
MLNRLEMLRIFCTAAEARNFKEAAQQLGISPQVVTRAIQELESQFGELLFHRNTRQCRVTREGERLAHIARQGVEGIDCLFRRAEANATQQVEGTVADRAGGDWPDQPGPQPGAFAPAVSRPAFRTASGR